MMNRIALAAALLASAAPLAAETHRIEPAQGQSALQEALILAQPGDTIELGEGRFTLTDGLSLDVDGVTVRGQGMEKTVLDFTGQQGAGEGLLVTSDNVTLRGFAVENPKGDGIKSKGADNIVYHRVRVTWTGGPLTTNGAYGIYPVESSGVLIDGCVVAGASDAGIYVGQSRLITVRYSSVEHNVAGIEIENSREALVTKNFVTRNTAGILVFDLPGLPVMGGGRVRIEENLVVANDTPNFAPKGNIVASVPQGTGIMIMANEDVAVRGNTLIGHKRGQIVVIAYPNEFDDKRYNPFVRKVVVRYNQFSTGNRNRDALGPKADDPATAGEYPLVLWDGLGGETTFGASDGSTGLNLNLPARGAGLDKAKPAPFQLPAPGPLSVEPYVGAPSALDDRITP